MTRCSLRALVAPTALVVVALAGCGADAPEAQTIKVPNVTELTVSAAKTSLRKAGLTASTRRTHDDTVASGRVIFTDPPGGAAVRPKSRVTLTISTGPAPPPLTAMVPSEYDLNLNDVVTTMDQPHITAESDSSLACYSTHLGGRRAMSTFQIGSGSNAAVLSVSAENMGSAASAHAAVAKIETTQTECLASSPVDYGTSEAFLANIDHFFSDSTAGHPVFGFTKSTVVTANGQPIVSQSLSTTWNQGPYLINVEVLQVDDRMAGYVGQAEPYLSGVLASAVASAIDVAKAAMKDPAGKACCGFVEAERPPEPTTTTPRTSDRVTAADSSDDSQAAGSDQANGIDVPDVTGLDAATARARLSDLGFLVTTEGVTSTQSAGTVVDQDPQPGTSAEPGTDITLSVAL